jgi:pimeloyl-ACP methyl ester carboxylesterase
MSVAEYTKIKIKNDAGRARRVGDARTFQRYAAGIIRLVPATALAIGRRIAHLMIPLLMVGVTAAGCGGDVQTAGPTAPSPASAKPTIEAWLSIRQVTAQVAGRTLQGHCRGVQQDVPPVLLDSGLSGGQDELARLEEQLAQRTVVCAYDRAGVGESDPSAKTPRPLSGLVADLDAFATAANVRGPYVLVGHSTGATVVFMYAQTHPDKVAGFVSMNPVPPQTTYLKAIRKVQTKPEYQSELAFYRGENDEQISFGSSEQQLTIPLPATMPYVVMFDENCEGDSAFCRRVLPALTRVTKAMAAVGKGGQFLAAKGAGHQIYATRSDLVLKTVEGVLGDAN